MSAKNETVKLQLDYMLQTAAPDIQDQLNHFFTKIVEKLVLTQASRGKGWN